MTLRQPFIYIFFLYWIIGILILRFPSLSSNDSVFSISKSIGPKYLLANILFYGLAFLFYLTTKSGLELSELIKLCFNVFMLIFDFIGIAIFIRYCKKDKGITFALPVLIVIFGRRKAEEKIIKAYNRKGVIH